MVRSDWDRPHSASQASKPCRREHAVARRRRALSPASSSLAKWKSARPCESGLPSAPRSNPRSPSLELGQLGGPWLIASSMKPKPSIGPIAAGRRSKTRGLGACDQRPPGLVAGTATCRGHLRRLARPRPGSGRQLPLKPLKQVVLSGKWAVVLMPSANSKLGQRPFEAGHIRNKRSSGDGRRLGE